MRVGSMTVAIYFPLVRILELMHYHCINMDIGSKIKKYLRGSILRPQYSL